MRWNTKQFMSAVVGNDDGGKRDVKACTPHSNRTCSSEVRCVHNRTVLAAMTNKQSHDNGVLSEDEIAWLEARSEGGFGIITTAATHVEEDGQGWEGEFGTWSDELLEGLTQLATAIHQHGGFGLAQLFHGGMRAPERLTGLQPKSASENELGHGLGQSRAMTSAEIEERFRPLASLQSVARSRPPGC